MSEPTNEIADHVTLVAIQEPDMADDEEVPA